MNTRITFSDSCPLTGIELECVRMIADGKTAEEVAAAVYRAKPSIDSRLRNARRVTGCRTSTELVATALRKGWIS